MATILHLETATKVCSVALSVDGKLVAVKESEEDGYSHGENLTLFIEDVVSQAGISVRDLDAVSVASGPGSYTGLRIGASTAKGICYAVKIPLIAIDALTSLSELVSEKHPNQNVCAMIDARRMEAYTMISDGAGTVLKEISADILDETSYSAFDPFVFAGDAAQKAVDLWQNRACTPVLDIVSSARGQVRLAHEKFGQEQFEDVAYWEPFYLKDFIVNTPKRPV